MDVCKCIKSLRHGDTLNSRRTASPLVRLVEEEERREAPDHPQGVLPQNWDRIGPNLYVSNKYKQDQLNAFCAYGPDKNYHTPIPLPSPKRHPHQKLKFVNSGSAQLPK
ncbi:hypothetical protein TNCV_764381 [Trichonephila clavipes]|nr:hypothetical protein TNCV_764381 [Trichonephila clavipes]